MASPQAPDYNSIVHSTPFTFLVGPHHTKLTVQSGIAKHVSPRLDELMNNGHSRESRHRIAVLEEQDVETFVGFCEFAYTGDYTVPRRKVGEGKTETIHEERNIAPHFSTSVPPLAPSPPATPKVPEEQQDSWEDSNDEGEDSTNPFTGSAKKTKKNKKDKKKQKGNNNSAVEDGADPTFTPPRTPPMVAAKDDAGTSTDAKQEEEEGGGGGGEQEYADATTPGPTDWFDLDLQKKAGTEPEDQAKSVYSIAPSRPASTNIWDEFTSIQYPQFQRRSAMSLPSPILHSVDNTRSQRALDPYLLFHAKIYVFATRYLIPTLAHLSLTKLHRDLVSFSLSSSARDNHQPSNVPDILELLHYIFVNTKREDPVFALADSDLSATAGENQLRKLVVHYAACRVRELASYQPPPRNSPINPLLTPAVVNVKGGRISPAPFGFRDLLDAIAELASDLVYRMM